MTKSHVIWSDEAITDLEIIYDFVSIQSQKAAQGIIEAILRRSKQLEDFPESGARHENLKNRQLEYRFLIEGNYKIVYRYQPEIHTVYITVIFDTRKNPEKLNP